MKTRKCLVCGKYTLREICTTCHSETVTVKPARFSPLDPYGVYRRRMKIEIIEDAYPENSS